MSSKVAGNAWGEIIHHESDGILELRWLPAEMTDGAFKATLTLLAWEAEKLRPAFLLIDATRFRHQFGAEVMRWRDDCIIPRYGAAGVTKFAFHMPEGMPMIGMPPVPEEPGRFPTGYFGRRQDALDWLTS